MEMSIMSPRSYKDLVQSVLALLVVLASFVPVAWGQADVHGSWSTLPYLMPTDVVHAALLYNGKVLVIAGSKSTAGTPSLEAALWDPQAGTITIQTTAWYMFCNGMTALSDGRILVSGGTIQDNPFLGSPKVAIYDPATNGFTEVQSMAHGRWYPSATLLSDGRVMVFSGLNETTGDTNNTVEIYTVGSGWSTQYTAPFTPPLYPRMHLLPNGKLFFSGSTPTSYTFNPSNQAWTTVANTKSGITRTYGSSVLLPLTPANNYDPRVIIFGGGQPTATSSTEIIDLGASSPSWVYGPDMSQARVEMDAVLLPTGKVLALAGSSNDEDATTASLNADLYDPASNSFSSAGANAYPRMYHTVALLMPDATVWLAGSNPSSGVYEQHMEIYQPAYLFTRDGNNNVIPATRPTITSAPSAINWGGQFAVSTPDAANISSAVLMKLDSSTHAFDLDQREVGLNFTAGSGTMTVTAPPNANIAPPGYYMLFLINNQGVPSTAAFVLLNSAGSAPAPTVASVSPNSGAIGGGTGITITGTNFLAGAVVTVGGTAATGITVVSSTSIRATTPAHSAGGASVVVTNTDGQSGTLSNGYTYANPAPMVTAVAPNSGPVSGGTAVTITGANFVAGAAVSFGGIAATNVTVASSTSITATTPAGAAGAVNVAVTNTDNQSGTLSNGFTYTSLAPAVTSVAPNSGPVAGGTVVTITGTNFQKGATVSFGGTAAINVTVASSTSITATTPTDTAGAVTVVVTDSNKLSGALNNGYTYTAAADFAMTVATLAPGTIAPGGSASASITITPLNGFTGDVTLSCGAVTPAVNPPPTCAFSPSPMAGPGISTLTVHTTAAKQAYIAPSAKSVFYAMWLPIGGLLLFGPGITLGNKKLLRLLMVGLLFSSAIFLASCGGGSSTPAGNSGGTALPGTPAGTYSVSVTGTAGSLTHTATVSFTVN
jgi:Domain of unknown function (DUF1929)/IPT/TIG domain/Glyoxal oxidase N-terminus